MLNTLERLAASPVPLLHLLAGIGIALLLGAWLHLVGLRRARAMRTRLEQAEAHLRCLQKDLAALLACSRGLANRVGEQGTSLRLARTVAQAAVPLQRVDTSEPQFRSARALILRGASTTEVARTCGLSHGEVELLARITPRAVE